jgi:hypothetical protein
MKFHLTAAGRDLSCAMDRSPEVREDSEWLARNRKKRIRFITSL